MPSELSQADRDAMLIAEVAALSVRDPTVWENYLKKWTDNVNRRVEESFAADTEGRDS